MTLPISAITSPASQWSVGVDAGDAAGERADAGPELGGHLRYVPGGT
jgi:hypothetical protein